MKFIFLTVMLFAAVSLNMSVAHETEGHSPKNAEGSLNSEGSLNAEGSAKEHKHGKRHHRSEGHHRDKIHKMMMSKADTNEDGKVDLNEYLQNAQQRFEGMDADADGFVTGEEMREAGKAMRQKHKEAMKAARKSYKESAQDTQ